MPAVTQLPSWGLGVKASLRLPQLSVTIAAQRTAPELAIWSQIL